jgi:simple sugar transport system permease protein
MLNYVAAILSSMCISIWIKSGSQSFGVLSQGIFPTILGSSGTLVIIFAIVIFIGMFFYINLGKRGYEVSIIGDSAETAR